MSQPEQYPTATVGSDTAQRRDLSFWFWVIGVLIIIANTQYTQSCHAPWLTLVIACFVILSLLLNRPKLVLAAAVMPFARWYVADGIPNAHDIYVHAWNIWNIGMAMFQGDWWPLWLDRLGIGQPTLVFYAPIPYALGGLLVALGVSVPVALALLALLASLAGAAGVAWVMRRWRLKPLTIGCCVLAYLVAPYRLLDINYRYAVAELFGLACMLPFWECLRWVLSTPESRRARRSLWLSASAIVLCHPLSALMATTIGLVAVIDRLRKPSRTKSLAALVLVTMLSICSVAFYVLPAAVHSSDARISAQLPKSPKRYRAKALRLDQAFIREAWDGRRISFTVEQEQKRLENGLSIQEVPFYLGACLFLPLILIGFASRQRIARVFLVMALCAFGATLVVPATVMGQTTIFYPLQFPWRFLGPATVACIAVLGFWLDTQITSCRAAIVGLLLLMDGWAGFGAGSWTLWPDVSEPIRHAAPAPSKRQNGTCDGPTPLPLPKIEVRETPENIDVVGLPPVILQGRLWAGYPDGDIPTRVWQLKLPPRTHPSGLANVHYAPPEFLTSDIRRNFVRPARIEGDRNERKRVLGTHLVVSVSEKPTMQIDPWPYVMLLHQEKLYGLRAKVERRVPNQIDIDLPVNHPGGQLIVIEQMFPGWLALSEGVTSKAISWRGLLSTTVAHGEDQVHFEFTATRIHWIARLISTAGLLAALLIFWRRK